MVNRQAGAAGAAPEVVEAVAVVKAEARVAAKAEDVIQVGNRDTARYFKPDKTVRRYS